MAGKRYVSKVPLIGSQELKYAFLAVGPIFLIQNAYIEVVLEKHRYLPRFLPLLRPKPKFQDWLLIGDQLDETAF